MAVRPDTTSKSSTPAPAKNEEDLEQYGVWVKAEPQDILEEPEILPLGGADFDLPPDEALPSADSFLTDDEEKLLGSFDTLDIDSDMSLEAPQEEKVTRSQPSSPYPDIADIENLPPLQDFEIGDTPNGDIEDIGVSTIDISLDELESSVDYPSPISPHTKLDPEMLSGLDSRPSAREASLSSDETGMEDVSAEFLDLEDGDTSSRDSSDVTSEFLDAADAQGGMAMPTSSEPDFEPIDMDLHFDDTAQAAAAGGEPGFEAVSEFDDFLTEEAPSAAPLQFDDLAAVEDELSSPIPEPRTAPPSRQVQASLPAEAGLANDLLMKIADELSSIRSELVNLKSQFGAIKAEEKAEAVEETEGGLHVGGGFFDDEEDETIALTGDELDNILNTADFTEENADGSSEALAPPSPTDDLLMEALLPENGDYRVEEPAIEEIRLEPATETNPSQPEGDGLDAMGLDEGVQHLTQAPEDTSYLEEPLPDEEPLDLSEIPLHEESLADATSYPLEIEAEDLEGEELEALEEISEELPVVDGMAAPEGEAEPLADLTLGMDIDSDYMNESPAEVESLAALPELEDIGFGELNLAEESNAPLVEEVPEELEELVMEEDLEPMDTLGDRDLEATIEAKTVKPSEPISFHPDEIPTSLDDSFFVGGPRPEEVAEEAFDLNVEEFEPHSTGLAIKEEPLSQPPSPAKPEAKPSPAGNDTDRLKNEIKGVLSYLDKLLESLPESKIEEFARSEHFDTYKRLFEELGLV